MQDKLDDANLTKIRSETSKLLADMEHDLHQRDHWIQQQKYWRWIIIFGFFAILVNGLKSLWS